MISLKEVSKTYISKNIKTQALNNINLNFNDRGLYFILGPSGSGKTTLLNTLGCLDKPTSGNIYINNVDINLYSEKERDIFKNQNIGFIFQSSNMVEHLTIEENIILPLKINKINKDEIEKKVRDISIKLGLEKEIKKYPSDLSGGQLQRAAIARALINDPKIILADEPTGSLDSENAKNVMKILKEISEERLVIMVSHNESYAYEYGNYIVEIIDGKVESYKLINEVKCIYNKKESKKTFKFLSLQTSVLLAFRNLISKKIRSIFTILGSSIGILAACIVLTISNSMENYSAYMQKQALSTYPITISSSVNNTIDPDDKNEFESYPNNNIINVVNKNKSYYSHVNVFSNEYFEYLKNLDTTLYTTMDYSNSVNMHVLSESEGKYTYLPSSSYFSEMNSNKSYLESEYDILYGDDYPSSENEIALVIDKYNCIDAYVLNHLGIKYKDINSYTFDEITKKEYKVIVNDDYYIYNESLDIYEVYAAESSEAKQKQLYDKSEITLKITAILRQKKDAKSVLYTPGILYTQQLSEVIHKNNSNSKIVKDQLKYGLSKNVFTGKPYEDTISDFYVSSKEYKLESTYRTLGYYYNISYIRIYTDKFENREAINEYLQNFNIDKDEEKQVLYSDYMGNITKEFEKFIDILMLVFTIFSCVAMLVSCIMIALLMYVSVLERRKEIGILRCLGYSKQNVSATFISEGALIGFISGVIGIGASLILAKPILSFVAKVVVDSYSSTFDVSSITSTNFNLLQLFIIIVCSIIIAIGSSLIPAIIASNRDPIESLKDRGE